MKLNDLEDIVSRVAMDVFNERYPNKNVLENTQAMQDCISDSAFIINKFIMYFNYMAEESNG